MPVVLSQADVKAVLTQLDGVSRLVASLLYGAGLRLQECRELRVKDIDFERHEITVRRDKGAKDRRVMLPDAVREPLRVYLGEVRRLHARDLADGFSRVVLPDALVRKYPTAPTEWRRQFVFPAGVSVATLDSGPPSRFHLHESAVQRVTERHDGQALQACDVSCLPAFVCDPPVGVRHRQSGPCRSCSTMRM